MKEKLDSFLSVEYPQTFLEMILSLASELPSEKSLQYIPVLVEAEYPETAQELVDAIKDENKKKQETKILVSLLALYNYPNLALQLSLKLASLPDQEKEALKKLNQGWKEFETTKKISGIVKLINSEPHIPLSHLIIHIAQEDLHTALEEIQNVKLNEEDRITILSGIIPILAKSKDSTSEDVGIIKEEIEKINSDKKQTELLKNLVPIRK